MQKALLRSLCKPYTPLQTQRHVDIYLAHSCFAEACFVAARVCSQLYELSGHVPKFSVPSELDFIFFLFLFVRVYISLCKHIFPLHLST